MLLFTSPALLFRTPVSIESAKDGPEIVKRSIRILKRSTLKSWKEVSWFDTSFEDSNASFQGSNASFQESSASFEDSNASFQGLFSGNPMSLFTISEPSFADSNASFHESGASFHNSSKHWNPQKTVMKSWKEALESSNEASKKILKSSKTVDFWSNLKGNPFDYEVVGTMFFGKSPFKSIEKCSKTKISEVSWSVRSISGETFGPRSMRFFHVFLRFGGSFGSRTPGPILRRERQ